MHVNRVIKMQENAISEEIVEVCQGISKIGLDETQGESISKDENVCKIPHDLQCPFIWEFESKNHVSIDLERKLEELVNDDKCTINDWIMFVLNLILCYEYAKCGELDVAFEALSKCDTVIEDCKQHDNTVCVIGDGLKHITSSTKCYLLQKLQQYHDIEEILQKIVPFDKLSIQDKGSILAVKGAYCSELGYTGINLSIKYFEMAISLDENRANWHFLLGRSLGRLRRIERTFKVPQQKELKAFEKAVELYPSGSYIIHLAQIYREYAKWIYFNRKGKQQKYQCDFDTFYEKSYKLYREVLQMKNRGVQILVRCALGFLKLPNKWRDLDSAKACILSALEKSPDNPMALHTAALYYEEVKDDRQAMHYMSRAAVQGVFPAEMGLIAMKMNKNKSYSPVSDLERLLEIYNEKPCQQSVLAYLGSYYYHIKKNIKMALEYWLRIIDMDIDSEVLKDFFDNLCVKRKLNISRFVLAEVMKFLKDGKISERERQVYEDLIAQYTIHHPGLVRALERENEDFSSGTRRSYSSRGAHSEGMKRQLCQQTRKI